jgi:hypothetical protein
MTLDRRGFLTGALAGAAGAGSAAARPHTGAPSFTTSNAAWQGTYDRALAVLAGNVRALPGFPRPVLTEGASYDGIWMECGPHEALVHRRFAPEAAKDSHLIFFALQKPDGQVPANIKRTGPGFGQIQMAVPIAATAWELAQATGDEQLLRTAYDACVRWDAWLLRYRNTRATGLTEGFCTYDTGQDNSPRWAGLPNRCPDGDARVCPTAPGLPRLCPDLSATTYGARDALWDMANELGRKADAQAWADAAWRISEAILSRLYAAADADFYDLNADGRAVRIDCDVLSRVCGERVPDQALFDRIWARRLGDPKGFWAPWPLPSVALDDPKFVRPIPPNSWGGAAQALTALRAPRWMEHYGRRAELAHLMVRWCEAIVRDGGFRQQLDPLTGDFTPGPDGYSPAALVLTDFIWRLAGVREDGGYLEWTVRPDHPATEGARFVLHAAGAEARMSYGSGGAELTLNGRRVARIEGGAARLTTDAHGRALKLQGVSGATQRVTLTRPGQAPQPVVLAANQTLRLR